MEIKIKGNEGHYIVKNESSILQYKVNNEGQQTGESVIHVITDSIENNEDRNIVSKKIEEFGLN